MRKNKTISEERILQLATFAGRIVLTSGGETYRVENVISQIGQHFNLKIDCFATLTCIIVTGKNSNDKVVSLIERITSRTTNLDKVHRVHNLVNNIENFSFHDLKKTLENIENGPSYSFWANLLASALGAATFVVLFKGGPRDFITAFTAGAGVSIFSRLVSNLELNNFFINLIGGAICAFVCNYFYMKEIIESPSISTISSLMLLVPGLAFINSIRDIIAGDLVSGTSRAMEVIMTGVAIAIGAGMVIKVFDKFGGF